MQQSHQKELKAKISAIKPHAAVSRKTDGAAKTPRPAELEEGTTRIMAGQKKNCWHGNMVSPKSSFRNQNNHNTWKQKKEENKVVFGLKQRSTDGGGASPFPTPSSLLPGPVVVGGVGAAVDVAVGLQAVLRRSHHVGGLHRGPGEEELRAEVNERLCSHAPEVSGHFCNDQFPFP